MNLFSPERPILKIDFSMRQAGRDLAKWAGIVGAVVLAIGIVILVTTYGLLKSADGRADPGVYGIPIAMAFVYWVGMGLWASKSPPPTGWSLRPFQKRFSAITFFFLLIYSGLGHNNVVREFPVDHMKRELRSLIAVSDSVFADSGYYPQALPATTSSSRHGTFTTSVGAAGDGWIGVVEDMKTNRTCTAHFGSGVAERERRPLCTSAPFRISDAVLGLKFAGAGVLLGLVGAFGGKWAGVA